MSDILAEICAEKKKHVAFAQSLLEPLHAAIAQHSHQLSKTHFAHRPRWQRWKDRMAYTVMRLTLFLSGNDY